MTILRKTTIEDTVDELKGNIVELLLYANADTKTLHTTMLRRNHLRYFEYDIRLYLHECVEIDLDKENLFRLYKYNENTLARIAEWYEEDKANGVFD